MDDKLKGGSLLRIPSQLQHWVDTVLEQPVQLTPLTGDASLRRYYRALVVDQSYIVMDASAANEETSAFVAIARSFKAAALEVPIVHYEDLEQGYVLLSDLGDTLYSHRLSEQSADTLYHQALTELFKLQQCQHIKGYSLPPYDRQRLVMEMSLFDEWFWRRHLGYILTDDEQEILDQSYDLLAAEALSQTRVCVHRDYHSRNLMILENHAVGILDFQDAVMGPVTYDLVSLLRDCYIDWPEAKVHQWALAYYQLLQEAKIIQNVSESQFLRWFDWMGLQRHLKCLGIFARLNLRDHKPSYLQYLPRVLRYSRQVTSRYPELSALNELLNRVSL